MIQKWCLTTREKNTLQAHDRHMNSKKPNKT